MELIERLQSIIIDTTRALDLLDTGYATVIFASPLTLCIEGTRLNVTEPVAVMTDNVRYKAVSIQGETVVINKGLKPGDKVLYLKANSGQSYIVISKV